MSSVRRDLLVTVTMRPRMAFVSTMFLQPEDNGARIRTCNILRGLKGGRGKQALGRRARLAEYAVNARIVTARELPLLDEERRRSKEAVGGVA